jgi:UDP-N-acetylmuramate--alanine ligase
MSTHFLGIGGIGMSALAHILIDREGPSSITGCDQKESEITQKLQRKGASIAISSELSALPETTHRVVVSSAISPTHPLRTEALERGLTVLHRSELLNEQMKDQEALLVTGTHGKTTTSALLAWVLYQAGWDPSTAIGGEFCTSTHLQMLHHGRSGEGLYFVAEADESDGSFLTYQPRAAILTNCDHDHLDHYGSAASYNRAMSLFAHRVPPEGLLWCKDDASLQSMGLPGYSYGVSREADWQMAGWRWMQTHTEFSVRSPYRKTTVFQLPLVGEHSALNATAAVALLSIMGVSEELIHQGLASFPGVKRRCQMECSTPYIVMHDYAHHPTEIRAVLKALRTQYQGRRLVVAFQPHRFSRTHQLLDEFSVCFEGADALLLTEIYAASEGVLDGVTSEALALRIVDADRRSHTCRILEVVEKKHLAAHLQRFLQPEDLLICMGAGDIDRIAIEVAQLSRPCGG